MKTYPGLSLEKMTVTGGVTDQSGGGVRGTYLSLHTVEIHTNQADSLGGGAYSSTRLNLWNSHLHDNDADVGGGLYSASELSVVGSTISDNSATSNGGGIYSLGTSHLTNSTLSGNSALSSGGGLFVSDFSDLRHVTFAANTAAADGDSMYAGTNGSYRLFNSIFSGDCGGEVATVWESLGGNLESPGDTCMLIDASDQPGISTIELALLPLADNGGPTPTHAFDWLSVARDAAVTSVPARGEPTIDCPSIDQRGLPRSIGSACDTGSYEHQGDLFRDGFETGDFSRWSTSSP